MATEDSIVLDHVVTDDEVRQLAGDDVKTPADELKTKVVDQENDDHEDDDAGDDRAARVDEELEGAQNDEERQKIISERRDARKARKQRQREARDATERRMAHLEAQNRQLAENLARLQGGQTQSEIQQLDAAIKEAEDVAKQLIAIEAKAITEHDGETATQARERSGIAKQRAEYLRKKKDELASQSTKNTDSPLNPQVAVKAVAFAQKHSWYEGPASQSEDSQLLGFLDKQLTRERWDPSTDEYWTELETRARKYLPHRFKSVNNQGLNQDSGDSAALSAPVGGSSRSGGGSAMTGGSKDYSLSAARVQALKDAGIWEDPARRAAAIKNYREYDARSK